MSLGPSSDLLFSSLKKKKKEEAYKVQYIVCLQHVVVWKYNIAENRKGKVR